MEATWFPVNHPVPQIQGTWYKQLTQFCYTGRHNHPQKLSLSISFMNISRLRIDVLVFLMNTTGAASCTWIDSHILTWTGYNPWLVHWFSQSRRRPRDCLKPMNRLQLYPSSFKKNRFVVLYSVINVQLTINCVLLDNSKGNHLVKPRIVKFSWLIIR